MSSDNEQLPTLADHVAGVVGRNPWQVQCYECGRIGAGERVRDAIRDADGARFHLGGWPDGTNPRLCRSCRLGRGCACDSCERERKGL